jgi:hypothetical protein
LRVLRLQTLEINSVVKDPTKLDPSLKLLLLISKKKGNKLLTNKMLRGKLLMRFSKSKVSLKTQLRSWNLNKMMKYQYALLSTKPSTNLSSLHNNKTMRLVAFLFRILMIPCSMIQRVKEKWNPQTR